MFLPTTLDEVRRLGWDALDVILVSGDSYIDSPQIGVAVIGKMLVQDGFRVGILAQPRYDDIGRLGEPRLFWGVTAGSVDSMVANYTALKKRRKSDDYTPGGVNNRRPDRASIVYANWIRRFSKPAKPIVLGGIEASLRRVPHYDYWDDAVRRSILFDAKADYLLYGMAEKSTLAFARALREGADPREIRGLCYIAKEKRDDYIELPSYEAVAQDKFKFIEMFHTFYRNNDPICGKGLCQRHGDRWLVHNPPSLPESSDELDAIYSLDYERAQHPFYEQQGAVKALETIRFSITTHRGCYGECNFCAIAVHEGRFVRSRSAASIVREAEQLTRHPQFKGYIHDVGGPTANMFGFECVRKFKHGACPKKRCIFPDVCAQLPVDYRPIVNVLRRVRALPGVKKVFVASGIRYDMSLSDEYLRELVSHHVSGQLKVAPEHINEFVLDTMGKPGVESLLRFKKRFDELSRAAGKRQFLTYYLIAAHPGCTEEHMLELKRFVSHKLQIHPEQVQIFTPTPSTYSTLMYYTELDPFTRKPLRVVKQLRAKEHQKNILLRPGRG